MLDDRFDDLLRESARDYNDPPESPREEMWTAIQAKRTEKASDSILPFRALRHLRPLRPFLPSALDWAG
jgi:predicted RNA-binding protein with PUA-like domain